MGLYKRDPESVAASVQLVTSTRTLQLITTHRQIMSSQQTSRFLNSSNGCDCFKQILSCQDYEEEHFTRDRYKEVVRVGYYGAIRAIRNRHDFIDMSRLLDQAKEVILYGSSNTNHNCHYFRTVTRTIRRCYERNLLRIIRLPGPGTDVSTQTEDLSSPEQQL